MTIAKEIREKAEAAQAAFEQNEKSLYRADGEPIYGEAEMKERIGALKAERRRVCQEAAKKAETEAQEARAKVSALEHRDTTALLSTEEIAAAAARKSFIEDTLAGIRDEVLLERLRSVRESGDRPGMYVHLQAANKRTGEGSKLMLKEEIGRLEAALFGETAVRELQEAKERLAAFEEAGLLSLRLQDGARSASEAFNTRLSRRTARAAS